MDCLYEDIAVTMQIKMTCFVLAKHSHKHQKGSSVWRCGAVSMLDFCPLEVKILVNCAEETNTYAIILTFASPAVNL
jgi:hypothetical protein